MMSGQLSCGNSETSRDLVTMTGPDLSRRTYCCNMSLCICWFSTLFIYYIKTEKKLQTSGFQFPKKRCFFFFFGRFPGVAPVSSWLEFHVCEDGYGAVVGWYWQGKTEVLGEKPVTVPLRPPQISLGMASHQTRALVVRGHRLTAWGMVQT
jgi:hypothetical protein